MRTFAFCCLFVVAQAFCASTATSSSYSPVTVLLNYDKPHSASSFAALQQELKQVLNGVGLQLDIRERNDIAPHEQFAGLVLFEMKGSCSMDGLPANALRVNARSAERAVLAMAYSADGAILPFGVVECDQVRKSLQRIVGRAAPQTDQAAFGSALGLVIAHEIYHMLAHSSQHTRHGITKESLSPRELVEGTLSLPNSARLAMRDNLNLQR